MNGRSIDGNLVRPGTQNCAKILHRADSSAYGKGNKYILRHLLYHIDHSGSGVRRCGDIKKYQLIGPLSIVNLCDLHRIPGIPKIHKIDSLDNTSLIHIQTWNNSLCKHRFTPPVLL